MHSFILEIRILKEILDLLIIDFGKSFVMHIHQDSNNITFQTNYDNNTFISYKIPKKYFIDAQKFETIVLNKEQCQTLVKISNMFQTSIGITEEEDTYEIFVSHEEIKLVFYKDDELEKEYIIPPPKTNANIKLYKEFLYNAISLVKVPGFVTPLVLDCDKQIITTGDQIQSIIPIKTTTKDNTEIVINPISLLQFLEHVQHKEIELIINPKLALSIHLQSDIGEIDYYCAHYT